MQKQIIILMAFAVVARAAETEEALYPERSGRQTFTLGSEHARRTPVRVTCRSARTDEELRIAEWRHEASEGRITFAVPEAAIQKRGKPRADCAVVWRLQE